MEKVLNVNFLKKLAVMIQSRLIWYKHYFLWCDELIDKMEAPPYWIIDLSITKYIPDATKIIYNHINSQNYEGYIYDLGDLYIACLFIRYQRREISWATFLNEAGEYSDGYGTKVECEDFFQWLNELEDEEFSHEKESKQVQEIHNTFACEISDIKKEYKVFESYFRKYVCVNKR